MLLGAVIADLFQFADHGVFGNIEYPVEVQPFACGTLPHADILPALAAHEMFQSVAEALPKGLFRVFVAVVGKGHEVIPFALQINFAPKPRIALAGVVPLTLRLSSRIFICLFDGGEIVLQFFRNEFAAFALRQRLTFRISRFKLGFYAVCLRIAFPCRFS